MKKTLGYIFGYLNLGYLLGTIALIACVNLVFLNYGSENIIFDWADFGLIVLATLAFLVSFVTYILALIFSRQKALKIILTLILLIAIAGIAFSTIWYFCPEIIKAIM